MRVAPFALAFAPLLGTAQIWTLDEVHRASAARGFTGVYAAGENGAWTYAYASSDPGNRQRLVRVAGGETELAAGGSVLAISMNSSNDVLHSRAQRNGFTTTSRVGLFKGGVATTVATTTDSPGSYNGVYGDVHLADDGRIGYRTITGRAVFGPTGDLRTAVGLGEIGAIALVLGGEARATRYFGLTQQIVGIAPDGSWTSLLTAGGASPVRSIGQMRADAFGNLFFRGRNATGESLFRLGTDGMLEDLESWLPGRNLGDAISVSADGRVAFTANVAGTFAVHARVGGVTQRVAAVGDVLGVGTLRTVNLEADAWDADGRLLLGFSDGFGPTGSGYLRATPVPEPASMAVLGLGLAVMRRRRQSQRTA